MAGRDPQCLHTSHSADATVGDALFGTFGDTTGRGTGEVTTVGRRRGAHHTGFHSWATCSCGWGGRRRSILALVLLDAWQHAAQTAHTLHVPLVLPAPRNDHRHDETRPGRSMHLASLGRHRASLRGLG